MARWFRGGLALAASARLGSAADLFCPQNTTADDVLAGLDLTGKMAVVTGGDSGLGFAITEALVKRGATVVIANRNTTAGEIAAQKIGKATGKKAVTALALDLSSLESVRSFATQYIGEFGESLSMLVNNAGIAGPSVKSKDGYELVFEIDYLGHYLLTELLLPSLRAAAKAEGSAHVVNVASGAHENACETAGWPRDCFKDFTYLPPPVVPKKTVVVHYKNYSANTSSSSYGIAKFLNIQHAAELAVREKKNNISAVSMTPGFALTSMTGGFDPRDPQIKHICETQVHPDPSIPTNPCPFSAAQGAAAIAYGLTGKARSGAYFSRTWACEEVPVAMQGFTEGLRAELYERSRSWALSAPGQEFVV
eukprot:TRINITY_DN55080_c0_g1_i1.p1 TRINITY_DN55080_c0_g1~~TRINITY_DN55080_c0_g1_i1.p1  ORF type:complete len:386 (-),score=86.06 TRINITY_DN55080_c0_g1_i1:236-1333(-)